VRKGPLRRNRKPEKGVAHEAKQIAVAQSKIAKKKKKKKEEPKTTPKKSQKKRGLTSKPLQSCTPTMMMVVEMTGCDGRYR
jgi:hypothetical protein